MNTQPLNMKNDRNSSRHHHTLLHLHTYRLVQRTMPEGKFMYTRIYFIKHTRKKKIRKLLSFVDFLQKYVGQRVKKAAYLWRFQVFVSKSPMRVYTFCIHIIHIGVVLVSSFFSYIKPICCIFFSLLLFHFCSRF